MADETYDFHNVRIRHETARAFLCEIGEGSFWVPKSQIVGDVLLDHGAGNSLTVIRWWAQVSGAQDAYESRESGSSQVSAEFPTASKIFRRLTTKYHPDLNPGSEEFMKDINEFWQAVRKDMKPRG